MPILVKKYGFNLIFFILNKTSNIKISIFILVFYNF